MPGFEQRPIGHIKGKPGDDHVTKTVPAHIHALPEAHRTHEHRPLIVAEPPKQQAAWAVLLVHEHRIAGVEQNRPQLIGHPVQHREARKQHERSAVRLPHMAQDSRAKLLDIVGLIRRGHRAIDQHAHLRRMVEGASQL